MHYNCKIFNTS